MRWARRACRWSLAGSFLLAGAGGTPTGVAFGASSQTPFEALAAQAAAAREAGDLERAADLYVRGLSENSDWEEGLWYLGATLYELARYAEGRVAFSRLLALQPEHAGAMGLRGLCAFHLGEYEEAVRDLVRARALGIDRTPAVAAPVRYHLGILLTRFSDFEIGYAVLSDFAREGNESPQVITALGLNLLRKPMLPAELAPADEDLIRLAGRAAFAMAARRAAAAQEALDELVGRFARTPNVHYARGVFRLADAPDQAVEEFRRELAVSPSHVPARLQLVFELLRRGAVEDARPYADEAVRLEPHYFAVYLARGQVLFELSQLPGAIADFETATRLAPESAQAHFVLARAYARAGRGEDAERERAEFTRLEELARQQPPDVRSVIAVPGAAPPPQ